MPIKRHAPKDGDTPSDEDLSQIRDTYSHEELVDAIDQLWRDTKLQKWLLLKSRRYWPRGDDPKELVNAAIEKILRTREATFRKDIPIVFAVVRNMWRVATSWGRSRSGKETATDNDDLDDLNTASPFAPARGATSEGALVRQITGRQLMERLLTAIREKGDPQLETYVRLRFDDELDGDELRLALGLDKTRFDSMTKAVRRLMNKIEKECRS